MVFYIYSKLRFKKILFKCPNKKYMLNLQHQNFKNKNKGLSLKEF